MRLASCSQLCNNLNNKINELCNCCWYAALKVHVVSVPESLPQRRRGSPVVLHTERLWANWRWYRGSQGAARVTTRTLSLATGLRKNSTCIVQKQLYTWLYINILILTYPTQITYPTAFSEDPLYAPCIDVCWLAGVYISCLEQCKKHSHV